MVGIGDDDQGLVDAGDPAGPDDLAAPPLPPKIPGCVGDCVVNATCSADKGPTTLSGTVSIPSGLLPVYNARVFIPTGEEIPGPPQAGAYCDRCDRTPKVFSTTTDINGKFTLRNIPAGRNMPLVIQVGKNGDGCCRFRKCRNVRSICSIRRKRGCRAVGLKATFRRWRCRREAPMRWSVFLRSRKLGLMTPSSRRNQVRVASICMRGQPEPRSMCRRSMAGHGLLRRWPSPIRAGGTAMTTKAKYDIVMLSCEGQQYMQYKSQTALQNLKSTSAVGAGCLRSHWQQRLMANAQTPQKIQTVATFANNLNLGTIAALINTNQDKARRWRTG